MSETANITEIPEISGILLRNEWEMLCHSNARGDAHFWLQGSIIVAVTFWYSST